MAGFLGAHAIEDGRRGGEGLPQAFGVVGVDALILFFEGDGQSENLAFGEAVKVFHNYLSYYPRYRATREAPFLRYTTRLGGWGRRIDCVTSSGNGS